MAWVRIDDHFDEHPKMAKVGPIGWGVWMAGLAYCNRNLTDGFIPWTKAHTLTSFDLRDDDGVVCTLTRDYGDHEFDIDASWVIDLLVSARLWIVVKGGFMVHDYENYQPSKAQIEEERAKKRAAGQAGGQAAAMARAQAGATAEPKQVLQQETSTSSSETQAKSNPKPNPTPNPVPTPKPEPTEDSSLSSADADGEEENTEFAYPNDFSIFWEAYPKKAGKRAALKAWQSLRPSKTLQEKMITAIGEQKHGRQWRAGFVTDPSRWLKDGRWDDEVEYEQPGSLHVMGKGTYRGKDIGLTNEELEERIQRGSA
jgi:hypothetical protein